LRLHELKPSPNSKTSSRRRGRGIGSGKGKTAGRGHKGQKARSGGNIAPGFEGGQLPLTRRVPKRGFNNKFRREWTVVNVESLNRFDNGSVVTPQVLKDTGVVKSFDAGIKILGKGDLEKELTVQAHSFSAKAKDKIEAAGGTVEVI